MCESRVGLEHLPNRHSRFGPEVITIQTALVGNHDAKQGMKQVTESRGHEGDDATLNHVKTRPMSLLDSIHHGVVLQ